MNIDYQLVQAIFQIVIIIVSIVFLVLQCLKNRKLIIKLAKRTKLYYGGAVIAILYLLYNHEQLRSIITKPPAYVYILSLFLGLVAYFGNMYKEKIEGMKMLTEAVKNYLDNSIHGVQNQVTDLDKRVTRIEGKVDDLDVRVTRIEAKVDDLDVRVTRIEAKVDDLDVRVTRIEGKVDNIETDVKSILAILQAQIKNSNP